MKENYYLIKVRIYTDKIRLRKRLGLTIDGKRESSIVSRIVIASNPKIAMKKFIDVIKITREEGTNWELNDIRQINNK